MTAQPPRPRAPYVADERTMLVAWLDHHRATLELKCAGIPAERLAERSVPPSSLSLLGLVRHMADVERRWFRRCLVGEDVPPVYRTDAEPNRAFDRADGAEWEADVAAWRAECDRARELTAATGSLDAIAVEPARTGEPVSLRWILVHMIEEYARHNGHADLLRERLDGATGS